MVRLSFAIALVWAMSFSVRVFGVTADVFDCTVQEDYKDSKGKAHVVEVHAKFALSKLKTPRKVSFEYLDQKSAEEFTPVVLEPKKIARNRWSRLETLNENAGLRPKLASKRVLDPDTGKQKWTVDKEKGIVGIELNGDGDGIDYAYLVLYKNAQYKKGYVKFKGPSKAEDWYQEIACTSKSQELDDFADEE